MVADDFLSDPLARQWLDGIEPAWTLLTMDSLKALRLPPWLDHSALQIAADLTAEETEHSPVARNALVLLRRAYERKGLPITATGNLTRAVVADMRQLIDWPDYDQADALRLHKVINEPDFMPLHIVRLLSEVAALVRVTKGKLVTTPLGRSVLTSAERGSLVALLFQIMFWRMDLSYFARGLLGSWPQPDMGIALWSLSVSAANWQTAENLTRLCTIPEPTMLAGSLDRPTYAMEAKILRPLSWFGLLDHRSEQIEGRLFSKQHYYRKTDLFGRLLAFEVEVTSTLGARH